MWTVIGTLLVVAASIGAGVIVDRKWALLPRKKQLAGAQQKQLGSPGSEPATAIAGSVGELEQLRRTQRCSCRTVMGVAADGDRVTYDGRELRVLRFACGKCGEMRSVYVRET